MKKILIIEDDEIIYRELKKLFTLNGYDVIEGNDDSNINKLFDIAVLDINLPGKNGFEICAEIRKTKKCPVIFLTSIITPESELMSFAVGGDDFVRKPFNPAVLLARVARLLKTTEQNIIAKGKLVLDAARFAAMNGDKSVSLSKTEYTLLSTLVHSEGVLSQKEIVNRLWDNEAFIDENTLYVNINRLREKLSEIDLKGAIKTVRGFGYGLEQL